MATVWRSLDSVARQAFSFPDEAEPWDVPPDVLGGLGEAESGAPYEELLEALRAAAGVDFRHYREAFVRHTLDRQRAARGLPSLRAYWEYAQQHPGELQELAQRLLVRAGSFFRDPEVFDFLGDEALPELINAAQTEGRSLRLWSAGCATGEEAYSLAMLVATKVGTPPSRLAVEFVATDVDPDAIEIARMGSYRLRSLHNVPLELKQRYLRYGGVHGYEVSDALRGMIEFSRQDLTQTLPDGIFDLVLCRNVLVFFNDVTRRRVLDALVAKVRPGGYFVQGRHEPDWPVPEVFETRGQAPGVFIRPDHADLEAAELAS